MDGGQAGLQLDWSSGTVWYQLLVTEQPLELACCEEQQAPGEAPGSSEMIHLVLPETSGNWAGFGGML